MAIGSFHLSFAREQAFRISDAPGPSAPPHAQLRPIDGPGLNTVVSDYTAILDTSWYNTFEAPPLETDHPIILTYSFETSAYSYLHAKGYSHAFITSFAPLTGAEKTLARDALGQWADASGIIFIEVPHGEGDIQFGKYDFDKDPAHAGFAGFAYYPTIDDSDGDFYAGDVFINKKEATIEMTLLHEIGHAIGMKHPFEGDPTLSPGVDDHDHTVMSYTGGVVTTLGPFDLDAVKHVYSTNAHDGDHVASWSWNAAKRILTQTGGGAGETIRGIHGKDIISGNGGNDTLYGNANNDKVLGGAGNDVIYAGDGKDTANGGGGNDHIYGGSGNDKLIGGSGNDTIEDSGGTNNIIAGGGKDHITIHTPSTINAGGSSDDVSYFMAGNAARTLTVASISHGFSLSDGTTVKYAETFFIATGNGKDKITFNNVPNGEYSWDGKGGTDTLVANFSSATKFVLSGASGGSLYAVTNFSGGHYLKEIFLTHGEKMQVTGGSAGDTLGGGPGGDVLNGGGGGDFITGAGGSDFLNGGAGPDTFIYDAVSDLAGPARDTVTGFDATADFFDVFAAVSGIDSKVTSGKLSEGSFNANMELAIGSGKLHAHHAVLWQPSSGNLKHHLFLIVDQNGVAGYQHGGDLVIELKSAAHIGSLSTANFHI